MLLPRRALPWRTPVPGHVPKRLRVGQPRMHCALQFPKVRGIFNRPPAPPLLPLCSLSLHANIFRFLAGVSATSQWAPAAARPATLGSTAPLCAPGVHPTRALDTGHAPRTKQGRGRRAGAARGGWATTAAGHARAVARAVATACAPLKVCAAPKCREALNTPRLCGKRKY